MSYKHNNLMAMRLNYWNDDSSPRVISEKKFFQEILNKHEIFQTASLEDAKYFFFLLPSIIIVKGYALGFSNNSVKKMINEYIQQNKKSLSKRVNLKIQYRIT